MGNGQKENAMNTVLRDVEVFVPPCPNVAVRVSRGKGNGLFATARIEHPRVIGEYTGDVRQCSATHEPNRYALRTDWGTIVPSPTPVPTNMGMINDAIEDVHVAHPHAFETVASVASWRDAYECWTRPFVNCALAVNTSVKCAVVITLRDIEEDEEILVKYGAEYWINHFIEDCISARDSGKNVSQQLLAFIIESLRRGEFLQQLVRVGICAIPVCHDRVWSVVHRDSEGVKDDGTEVDAAIRTFSSFLGILPDKTVRTTLACLYDKIFE